MDEDEIGRASWRRVEFTIVVALAVTVAGLVLGQAAQQYAALHTESAPQTAQLQPRFNAIDYATTASLKSGTVIIGPCDNHKP